MKLKSVKAYSHFVRFSKVTLSFSLIIVMVFMVAVPLIAKRGSDMRLEFAAIEDKELDAQPAMINPIFQGIDNNNQPYKVKAQKAIQQDDDVILLSLVEAELTLEDGKLLLVRSDSGVYNLADGNLLLEGDVWVYHEGGHDMQTERVRLNTKQMTAYGDSPVQIISSYGRLRSDNFSIVERGNKLLFNNNVKMLLHN
jgi:lipopolysaccharide export system protein LptC